jgi:hypothetical protein
VNIVFLRHCVLLTCCFGRVGIAAAYNSHVQYFDGEDRRDHYDEFYEQLVRVKDIAALPFADTAQKLLVTYIREDLGQPRAANWYEGHWTGTYGRYSLAHAGYAGSNNNMGTEVDWRDMKAECPPSSTLGTFIGTLVSLIGQLGTEHRTLLSKHEPNLFPSRQYLTKRIFDEMQTVHYNTLRFSVLLCSVQGKKQADWDAITERIHLAGEPAAPLHLKIKAYHVDLDRGDVEAPGMILEQIATMVIPRASYIRELDPHGTRPFEDVKKEIKEQAWRYYHLVVNPNPNSTRGKQVAALGVVAAMNIYESFYLIQRNSSWAGSNDRMHFSKFAADQAPEDTDRPAPIPAMCSCKWCCKWTVCEHTSLLAYVFCPDYQVPEILVAETPALRKKTNSIRGTAGVKRRELMRKIAKNKQQSTNRLEYMDPPVHPAAAPPPAKEVAMPPAAEAAKTFVIPEAAPLSDDDEVQIVIRSY